MPGSTQVLGWSSPVIKWSVRTAGLMQGPAAYCVIGHALAGLQSQDLL